jgi:starch-binding outer membrane protein, SusD/RagB family
MKLKKYISIFAISATTLGGCSKDIDLKPTDVIDQTKAFQSVSDLDKGAIGAYAALSWGNSTYVGSIMSDEARISPENRGQGQFLHKWTHVSNDGDAARAWNNLYVVIDRVNRILTAIPTITANGATEQALKDRVQGEMLALRAFCHFELWRWYAPKYDPAALGVPYMTVSKISSPARDVTSTVFQKLEADLVAAKALIPATFLDVTRLTKSAVSATQARVALYKGDWDAAIAFSTEVITAVPLSNRTIFPSIWNDASNGEVVFKVKRVSGQTNTFWQDTNGDVFYGLSYKLLSLYTSPATDIRFSTYYTIANRGAGKDSMLVKKYASSVAGGAFVSDEKVFRTAEMILIRAEANARKNSPATLTAATADYNALRTQRISPYTNVTDFATQTAALAEIENERMRELCFEGHRYFDLKRNAQDIVRSDLDAGGAASTFKTLPSTNFRYLLPIPQAEIFANKNMVQNPGGY